MDMRRPATRTIQWQGRQRLSLARPIAHGCTCNVFPELTTHATAAPWITQLSAGTPSLPLESRCRILNVDWTWSGGGKRERRKRRRATATAAAQGRIAARTFTFTFFPLRVAGGQRAASNLGNFGALEAAQTRVWARVRENAGVLSSKLARSRQRQRQRWFCVLIVDVVVYSPEATVHGARLAENGQTPHRAWHGRLRRRIHREREGRTTLLRGRKEIEFVSSRLVSSHPCVVVEETCHSELELEQDAGQHGVSYGRFVEWSSVVPLLFSSHPLPSPSQPSPIQSHPRESPDKTVCSTRQWMDGCSARTPRTRRRDLRKRRCRCRLPDESMTQWADDDGRWTMDDGHGEAVICSRRWKLMMSTGGGFCGQLINKACRVGGGQGGGRGVALVPSPRVSTLEWRIDGMPEECRSRWRVQSIVGLDDSDLEGDKQRTTNNEQRSFARCWGLRLLHPLRPVTVSLDDACCEMRARESGSASK
ncbi:hypothetical protein C8Q74DRAFT_751980 [Fomes fomentarius]|nr:hypothetical protein C8Q74DRAFT_751980 [Fomes fomentarius]